MNLQTMVTDNITELLVKIVEFTHNRQKILTQNLNHMHRAGFVPVDLAVDEFSDLLNTALEEHMCNRRLVLCDTQNIKFQADGSLELKAIVDQSAFELLEDNQDEYVEQQISKLLENAINQRVAAELLRERQDISPLFE